MGSEVPFFDDIHHVKLESLAMSVSTYEAIVVNGQIKLPEAVRLPEGASVYVVVPSVEGPTRLRVGSPRLVHPSQAADFVKEVTEEPRNAGL